MISKATKTALASAVVLSAAFGAQAANAALITNFDYTVDSAFSNYTGTGGDGTITPSGSGYSGDPTTLSWGTVRGGTTPSNPQSSISITPEVTGSVATNGAAADGATFTHNNRIIPDTSNTLDQFNLNTKLYLTASKPASEAGTSPNIPALAFDSFFTETENSQPCVSGSQSTCDDIFVLSNSMNGGQNPARTQTFTADGIDYTVALNISGLSALNADQCGAAGAGTGCVGFLTQESQDNTFGTSFTITANQPSPVPEPGNLAMLGVGLGLIGFGFFARRRNFQA